MKGGALYALGAYLAWGVFPAYWKLLEDIPPVQILAWRVVWAGVFFLGLLAWRTGQPLKALARLSASLPTLLLSALLIGFNWCVYIAAVNSGHVMEASLGYFLSPLCSIALGLLFLGEKLTWPRWLGVALALAGVFQLGWGGGFPWLGSSLGVTFGLYGLLRKQVRADALSASALETLLLAPAALALLAAPSHFGVEWSAIERPSQFALLILSGAVTGLPLLWFTQAAVRMPLSALGFYQFLSPVIQLLLAVLAYGEAFTPLHARSFGCIWAALAITLVESAWRSRAARALPRP